MPPTRKVFVQKHVVEWLGSDPLRKDSRSALTIRPTIVLSAALPRRVPRSAVDGLGQCLLSEFGDITGMYKSPGIAGISFSPTKGGKSIGIFHSMDAFRVWVIPRLGPSGTFLSGWDCVVYSLTGESTVPKLLRSNWYPWQGMSKWRNPYRG